MTKQWQFIIYLKVLSPVGYGYGKVLVSIKLKLSSPLQNHYWLPLQRHKLKENIH